MNGIWLVSFDTDRIKEYVFATHDLRRIRGASAILEELNTGDPEMEVPRSTKQVLKDEIGVDPKRVICGGGAAMTYVTAKAEAERAIAAVERLYRQETAGAVTITGARLDIPAKGLEENFGQHFRQLSVELRKRKDQKGREPAVPLSGYLQPCEACGRYAAAETTVLPEGRSQVVCRSCKAKEKASGPQRNVFWRDFQRTARAQGLTGWDDETFPKDFSTIGQRSYPQGYLGFIYADGNSMGRVLEEMNSFLDYQHFAQGLDRLVRDITHDVLLSALKAPRAGTAPFEVLLVGGDDLMLVTAADAALDIALQITETFEKRSPEVLGKRLTLSTSVVIAHDSFPIRAMHDLAEALLKRAKRKSAETKAGTLDFAVITEAATAGLDVVRKEALTEAVFAFKPPPNERFFLTERPYTSTELHKLLCHAREFKKEKFPRKTLQGMVEGLFQSKAGAQFSAMFALGRAREKHRRLVLKFFEDFGAVSLPPWREMSVGDRTHYYSALADLAEIYPFVH